MSSGKTVVLGHTGSLGQVIMRQLTAQGGVMGYSSASLDLTQREALRQLDQVLDASSTVIMTNALTPEKGQTIDTLEANLAMLTNLGRYLQERPIARMVYVSSDGVYSFRYNPVTEETPVEPANFYALAKYAGERVFENLAEATGCKLLIIRFPALYGPTDRHNAYGPNRFLRAIIAGEPVRLFGNGEEQRDHVYFEDGARAISRLLEAEATGLFNVATGRSYAFSEVIDCIRQSIPEDFSAVAAPRQGEITHRHYDVSRLFLALPDFSFTPLEDGIKATYAAFKQAHAAGQPS